MLPLNPGLEIITPKTPCGHPFCKGDGVQLRSLDLSTAPGPQSFASSIPFRREVLKRFLNEFIDPGALLLRLVEVFHRAFNPGSPEQLSR